MEYKTRMQKHARFYFALPTVAITPQLHYLSPIGIANAW